MVGGTLVRVKRNLPLKPGFSWETAFSLVSPCQPTTGGKHKLGSQHVLFYRQGIMGNKEFSIDGMKRFFKRIGKKRTLQKEEAKA